MVILMNFQQIKKKFKDIADEFLLFIKDKKIIIHNAEFDLSHLNNELGIIGRSKLSKEHVVDTLEIAREKFPGSSISLDALCKRYRIDNSRREKHTALIDCELLTKVYINLIDQKEPLFNFNTKNETEKDNGLDKKKKYSKKILAPSPGEIEMHKKYLKNFNKKNFY